jgi:hypothetical protein
MNHADFRRSVIEILRGSPNGLTAIEIAQRLGTTAGNINSRLSKLAAYGIIGRVRGTLVHHASRGNVYLAPEPTAMPTATSSPTDPFSPSANFTNTP